MTGPKQQMCIRMPSHLSIFGKLYWHFFDGLHAVWANTRLCSHKHDFQQFFSGDTYTDEFMFLPSTRTCTADITHGSYTMEFF